MYLNDLQSMDTATNDAADHVKACREALAGLVGQNAPVHALVQSVHDIAQAEGTWEVLNYAARCVRQGSDEVVTYARCCSTFQTQLNDTWSGRTNDSHRARYDGITVALTALSHLIP